MIYSQPILPSKAARWVPSRASSEAALGPVVKVAGGSAAPPEKSHHPVSSQGKASQITDHVRLKLQHKYFMWLEKISFQKLHSRV